MGGSRLWALSTSIFLVACGDSPRGGSSAPLAGTGGAVAPSAGGSLVGVGGPGAGGANGAGAPSGGSAAVPGSGGVPVVIGGAAGASPGGGAPATGGVPSATGGAAGAGGASLADPPGTATIQTDSFEVAPGGEVIKCQNFDNPFAGKDTPVTRIVSDMTRGSHHLQLYNLTEGTSRTIEDCPASDFHAMVHASARPHAETAYKPGMAIKLRGATGLRLQLHYLNGGTEPIRASATIKLSPAADPASITQWAASLYLSRVYMMVPPGKGQTVTTSCSVPSIYGQIGLLGAGSHMHSRGVHFVAQTSSGVPLIDDTTWNEPPSHTYDPPVMLNPGDSVSWTCTYDNDTSMTLSYGDSAAKNEMCLLAGVYYSTNANATQLSCFAQSQNGGAAQPMMN
jgi:hypothetical protein